MSKFSFLLNDEIENPFIDQVNEAQTLQTEAFEPLPTSQQITVFKEIDFDAEPDLEERQLHQESLSTTQFYIEEVNQILHEGMSNDRKVQLESHLGAESLYHVKCTDKPSSFGQEQTVGLIYEKLDETLDNYVQRCMEVVEKKMSKVKGLTESFKRINEKSEVQLPLILRQMDKIYGEMGQINRDVINQHLEDVFHQAKDKPHMLITNPMFGLNEDLNPILKYIENGKMNFLFLNNLRLITESLASKDKDKELNDELSQALLLKRDFLSDVVKVEGRSVSFQQLWQIPCLRNTVKSLPTIDVLEALCLVSRSGENMPADYYLFQRFFEVRYCSEVVDKTALLIEDFSKETEITFTYIKEFILDNLKDCTCTGEKRLKAYHVVCDSLCLYMDKLNNKFNLLLKILETIITIYHNSFVVLNQLFSVIENDEHVVQEMRDSTKIANEIIKEYL